MKVPAKFYGINVFYDHENQEITTVGRINKIMLEIAGRVFKVYSDIRKKLTGKETHLNLTVKEGYKHLL